MTELTHWGVNRVEMIRQLKLRQHGKEHFIQGKNLIH